MQDVACSVKNGTSGNQWSGLDLPEHPNVSQRDESAKCVGEGGGQTGCSTEDGTNMNGRLKQLQSNDALSLASTIKSLSGLSIGKYTPPDPNMAALNSFLALAGGGDWHQSPAPPPPGPVDSESSVSTFPGFSVSAGTGTRHSDPLQSRYNPQWHSAGPQVVGYAPQGQYANPRRTYTHGWGGDAAPQQMSWGTVNAHNGISPNMRAGNGQVGRCLPGNQMNYASLHGRRVTNYPGFNVAQSGRERVFPAEEDDLSTSEDLKETMIRLNQEQGHYRGYEMPKVNAGLDAQLLDLIRSQQEVLNGSNSWMSSYHHHPENRITNKNKPFLFTDLTRTGPGPCIDGTQQQQQQQQLLNRATIVGHLVTNAEKMAIASLGLQGGALDRGECYSRKVFVGGLPPDIDEDEILSAFRRFGPLVVDWPHKAESKSYFPPKGYCFLLFQDELSVQSLVEACIAEDGKLFWYVSSPTTKDKPVQIRPWSLSDSDFVMDNSQPIDPRKTVFVGGVPRPLKAVELAMIMGRLYGGVCYAGIDTDPELKYPKGAGRVAFSNQQSYIAAISARFIQLQHGDLDKRVEVKPYVLDDQICDECQGIHSGGKFAPFFCANVLCLQYYCERCWAVIHSSPGREFHKPLVKEGTDRPRPMPFHWS